jgi:hypothetical protein
MYKQAKIIFKANVDHDWVDPISDDSFTFDDKIIHINNGHYTYDYEKELIDSILVFEIQEDEDAEVIFCT